MNRMPVEMITNRSEEKNATVLLTIGYIQSALYSGARKTATIESGIHTAANRIQVR